VFKTQRTEKKTDSCFLFESVVEWPDFFANNMSNSFESQFQLDDELRQRKQNINPEESRLDSFEIAAAKQIKELTKGSFDIAEEKWSVSGTVKGVRKEVFKALEGAQKDISFSPETLEARMWKTQYAKNTLDAIKDTKKHAQASITINDGFKEILKRTELHFREEQARKEEKLDELKEKLHFWNVWQKAKNYDFQKNLSGALDQVFEDLNQRVEKIEEKKKKSIFGEGGSEFVFKRVQKTLDLKKEADLWELVQKEIKNPNSSQRFENVSSEIAAIPLQDRIEIYKSLGYDKVANLKEAKRLQKRGEENEQDTYARRTVISNHKNINFSDLEEKLKEFAIDPDNNPPKIETLVKEIQDDLIAKEVDFVPLFSENFAQNPEEKFWIICEFLLDSGNEETLNRLSNKNKSHLLGYLQKLDRETSSLYQNLDSPQAESSRDKVSTYMTEMDKFLESAKQWKDIESVSLDKLENSKGRSFGAFSEYFLDDFEKFEAGTFSENEKAKLGLLWDKTKEIHDEFSKYLKKISEQKYNHENWKKQHENWEKKGKYIDENITTTTIKGNDISSFSQTETKNETNPAWIEYLKKEPQWNESFPCLEWDRVIASLKITEKNIEIKPKGDVPPKNDRMFYALQQKALEQIDEEFLRKLEQDQKEQFDILLDMNVGGKINLDYSPMVSGMEPSFRNLDTKKEMNQCTIVEIGEKSVVLESKGHIIVIQQYNGTQSNVGLYAKTNLDDYKEGEKLPDDFVFPSESNISAISLNMEILS
jgi:hypothetical protein